MNRNINPLRPTNCSQPLFTAAGWDRMVRIARIVHLIAAAVALCVASYLTFEKWQGRITNLIGCGGTEGCSQLLGGRWANWMLVPVSFWAITVYLPLLVLGVLGLTTSRRMELARMGAGILAAAALWFVGLQLFVEHRFCGYCFTMHACSLLLLLCIIIQTSDGSQASRQAKRYGWIAGILGGVLLIAGQKWGPQPATHELTNDVLAESGPQDSPADAKKQDSPAVAKKMNPPQTETANDKPAGNPVADNASNQVSDNKADGPADASDDFELPDEPDSPSPIPSALATNNAETGSKAGGLAGVKATNGHSRPVQFLDGKLRLDLHEVPVIGSVNAPHVVVKYFDYTCKSCRTMHGELAAVQKQFPNQLAVVVIPCPLDRACNPYAPPGTAHRDACLFARLGLAVWRADPKQFPAFHDYLFEKQGNISVAAARQYAIERVGEDAFLQAEKDAWIGSMLNDTIALYRRMSNQNPRMPKLLLGGTVILHGLTRNQQELIQALQQYAGLGKTTGSASPSVTGGTTAPSSP